jgi:hypothetical protein
MIFYYGEAFRRQRVPIVTTTCNYGGTRPWFRCLCGRRIGILFHGICLSFLSGAGLRLQQQALRWRPTLKAQSIRRRRGGGGNSCH